MFLQLDGVHGRAGPAIWLKFSVPKSRHGQHGQYGHDAEEDFERGAGLLVGLGARGEPLRAPIAGEPEREGAPPHADARGRAIGLGGCVAIVAGCGPRRPACASGASFH